MTHKARLSALDFEKARSMKELKAIACRLMSNCPPEWEWRVGTPRRSSPVVSVCLADRYYGFAITHHIPISLPYLCMEEELTQLVQAMMFERHDHIAEDRPAQ